MIVQLSYILYALDWRSCKIVLELDFDLKLASTLLGSSILSTLCLVDIGILAILILFKAFVAADCNSSHWLFSQLSITNTNSVSIKSSMVFNSLKSSIDIRVRCIRRQRSTVAIWVAIAPNSITGRLQCRRRRLNFSMHQQLRVVGKGIGQAQVTVQISSGEYGWGVDD